MNTTPQPTPDLVCEYWHTLTELLAVSHDIESLLWRRAFPPPCSRLSTEAGASASVDGLAARLTQYADDTRTLGLLLLRRCGGA